MRDQDLELIAALVEGRLEDESAARALIDSSPELREEYQAQKLAYQVMRGEGTASMTDSERAALHRDVWTMLHEQTRAKPAGTPWYYRWAPVAAGMFVAIGLVAILSQGGSGDSGEELTIAADMAETTSTAADTADETGGDADSQPETTSRTQATESDGAGAMATEEAGDIYRREADLLRQGVFGGRLQSYDTENDAIEDCIEASGLDRHRVLATLDASSDDDGQRRVAIAFPEGTELATAPLSFVDLDTCEVVYTDG